VAAWDAQYQKFRIRLGLPATFRLVHVVNLFRAIYPKYLQLGDGRGILLRLLNQLDGDRLIALLLEASRKTLRFIKFNRKDLQPLTHCLDQLDYQAILPLVAVDLEEHRFIASANLHLGQDASRLAGEISLYVAEPFQGLGLHSLLVDEIIRLAENRNLGWLKAEVLGTCRRTREILTAKGFETKTVMQDFFLNHTGAIHDVVVMVLPVSGRPSEPFKQ
jgi:GNAT superfamily N-acetyltransferase